MTVFGLLLAAGYGRRFDPSGRRSKLEETIDGEPVAVHACRALMAGCQNTLAICRPEQQTLATSLRDLGARLVDVRPDDVCGAQGMGVSLATGARAILVGDVDLANDFVLVMPADMPWVAQRTVQRIAAARGLNTPIIVPVFEAPQADLNDDDPLGRAHGAGISAPANGDQLPSDDSGHHGRRQPTRGHPVRFAARLLPELALLNGDVGARALLDKYGAGYLTIDDPGILRDVDTPGDLLK